MDRIETNSLILRKARPTDLAAMYRNIWQDETIAASMYWQPVKTLEEAAERLAEVILYQQEYPAYFVCLKETDEPIGFAGVRESGFRIFEESGICVAAKCQGRGYGKEILGALLKLVFEHYGARKFVYGCLKDNVRSKHVCQHFGFRYDSSTWQVRQWDNKRLINDFYVLTCDDYFRR